MAHAGKSHPSFPNLTAAIALNQRINNWVQSSILDMDLDGAPNEVETRCLTKRFFVKTAEVARRICHAWSSLTIFMLRNVMQSATSRRWVQLWGRCSLKPSLP
jgi:hypothetical protein